MVNAYLECAAAVGWTRVAGDRDNDEVDELRRAPEEPRHLEAVHAGHLEVEQRDLRPVLTGRFQGRRRVATRQGVVPPPAEQQGETARRVRVVVHRQDAEALC